MGNAARQRRANRRCRHCQRELLNAHAADLVKHAVECQQYREALPSPFEGAETEATGEADGTDD